MVRASLAALLLVSLPVVATAGVVLPPGFTRQVYVTGQGFDRAEQGMSGVPVATTLGFDAAGRLYLAKSGSRYGTGPGGEVSPPPYAPGREMGVVSRRRAAPRVLSAGGPPPAGSAPVLKQPEGV